MKTIKIVLFTIIFSIFLISFAFATPSPNWYQENGRYKLKDNDGNVITNAWVCDDMDDGKPWYLLDLYGNMVAGLALDNGKWYYLGSDGQLKFDSGYYDGVYFDINDSSGVIKNVENITFLIMKSSNYVTYVNTSSNLVNTSSFNVSSYVLQDVFNNLALLMDDTLLDNDLAVEYACQLAKEYGLNIQEIYGSKGGIRILGPSHYDWVGVISYYPDKITIFISNSYPANSYSYLPKTKKGIREAINQIKNKK